ncbi:MAG: helix-turn-helix transcriptional regulator [Eggerthellaceae bacterium]|nr:helix-turn-helix transcriptional regulator [Eggerthellaceae bacterium]
MDGTRTIGAAMPEGLMLAHDPFGQMTLSLGAPLGEGTMWSLPLAAGVFAATVDFRCERCPSIAMGGLEGAPLEGRWITVNLCAEGRCEVSLPGRGYAVVKEGDCCISSTAEPPDDYRYPLGRYRGVELFVHSSSLVDEAAFGWYRESGGCLAELAEAAGFAAVFSNDAELNGPLARIGQVLAQLETASRLSQRAVDDAQIRCKYELLGLLMALNRRGVTQAQPRTLLAPYQLAMARSVKERLEASLAWPHDARDLAAEYGVGATTLNRFFQELYGVTVAGYLRKRRMEEAGKLMRDGAPVATAAVVVGYSNPSKFAAAFKRETGLAPTEWRRRARMEAFPGSSEFFPPTSPEA